MINFDPIINGAKKLRQPYADAWDVMEDVFQPFIGIFNLMYGGLALVGAIVCVILCVILLIVALPVWLLLLSVMKPSSLATGALLTTPPAYILYGLLLIALVKISHGMTQILGTPITWLIGIAYRTYLTLSKAGPSGNVQPDEAQTVKVGDPTNNSGSPTDSSVVRPSPLPRRDHVDAQAISHGGLQLPSLTSFTET